MHWNQHKICGVTKPVTPGQSIFESGLVIDFGTTTPFELPVATYGWSQSFDYPSTAVYPGVDWATYGVIAF